MNDCDNCRHGEVDGDSDPCESCEPTNNGWRNWEPEGVVTNQMGPWPEPPEFSDDDAKVFGVPPLVTELERLRAEVEKLEKVRAILTEHMKGTGTDAIENVCTFRKIWKAVNS